MKTVKLHSCAAVLRGGCTAALLALMAASVAVLWWSVAQTDRDLRGAILHETRLVAQALDVGHTQALSGTKTDLYSPHYRAVREKLAAVCAATPRCRFAYVLARKTAENRSASEQRQTGALIFLADSEPEDSEGYSPPGEVYEGGCEKLDRLFETKCAFVEGPVSDHWGAWVSAFAPLVDPRTGTVVAVLGMDIDARNWMWDVAARAALPVGLVLLLLIGLGALLNARLPHFRPSARQACASAPPAPVMRRLLPPLASLFVFLLGFMGLILYHQHTLHLDQVLAADMREIQRKLHALLVQQKERPTVAADAVFGKKFEAALSAVHLRPDMRLAVALRKKTLVREEWEAGMRLLGRKAEWDRLPQCVISYDSKGRLPDVFAFVAEEWSSGRVHGETFREVSCNGRRYRLAALSLQDLSGKEVGDLLVARDLSAETDGFASLLVLGGMTGAVLLALLLGVTYVLLRNTDAGIRTQQDSLRKSEERLAQLAEQSRTVAWEVDAQGLFTYVSHAAETVFGYRPDELEGRVNFYDLHPENGREAFKATCLDLFRRRETIRNLVNPVQSKDGCTVWVATHGFPLPYEDGCLRGYRGSDTDITERKLVEDALRRSAVELRAMGTRLQNVREEERMALARELHDTLAQQLTALALHFELICMECEPLASRSPDVAAFYDSIVVMVPQVERLTERMQKIMTSLRPSILDELGLVEAIEWQVEETAKSAGLASRLALPVEALKWDRGLELALFRITQEALSNVVRHAQATCVEVRLQACGEAWELEVRDNGKGFAPESVPSQKAIGMIAMRERIGAFGGTVEFVSKPGSGTAVRVRVPGGGRAETGESL